MRRRSTTTLAAAAAGCVLLIAGTAHSDDPVTSAVRYNREIVRIFDRKCLACHGPDGVAMSLASYREVRPWSRAIREEIVEGHMPPTSAVRGYARLKDDIALTPRELATILTWVDGGVPRGEDRDLPPLPTPAPLPTPDHTVAIPEQHVPGKGQDVIRHVVVDSGLQEDRWVRLLQIRPGARRLLRAAFVSIVTPDRQTVWAGSWVPWQAEVTASAASAFHVPRGSRLSLELHYRGGEAPATDRTALAIFFAPEGARLAMRSVVLAPAPAATRAARPIAQVETTLERDVMLWGVRLEVAADGPSVELTARKPDGAVEVLLWVPKARADWPAPFMFQDPVALPAGTVISVTTGGTIEQQRTRAILTLHDAG